MPLPRPDKMEDAVLVTHKGCLDGAGCALMFLRAGGKLENIRYVAAGMVERFVKKDPSFQSGRFMIFADIGLNSPEYADVLERRGNLVVIDHHKTSLHLADRYWAQIEMGACGTELLRRYLEGEHWSSVRLAALIDDFDRWINKEPHAEDLATLMNFFGQERFVDRLLLRNPEDFTETERTVIDVLKMRRDETITDALRHVIMRDVTLPDSSRVTVAYVVSSDRNTSLMLERVLAANPQAQAAVQIKVDNGFVSLRSRGDYDVARMAAFFDGGGHAAAAGHRIPQDVLNDLVEAIHG